MQEIESIKRTIEKLRADLIATNAALTAVLTSMPPEDQRQALKAIAELSVLQEQYVERTRDPVLEESARQVLASTNRLHQAMQNAHQLRMKKLSGGEST